MMDKFLENSALPLALVIIALSFFFIFRSQISNAIDRFRGASFGNKSLDVSGNQTSVAVEKQKQAEGPVGPLTVPETIPASHMMPPRSEVHASIEREIQAALPGDLPRDFEKAWLIRALAVARVQRAHEMKDRLILGSQIDLLLQTNAPEPVAETKAREIYEGARAAFPNYPFENWCQWPVLAGLLRSEQTRSGTSVLKITPAGQDFLHYPVDNGLTWPRKLG